ncbi:peptidyl-prolyl cis-trans isomerase [Taklimakanibacter deserti]|uniref:peptidylprolyl isomerase n=1 Tax=Taklimakanibacter deserti TaxID=2267839 RepID=UPI000E659D7F
MSHSNPSFLKRLVCEPLLHFVLIGAALFFIGNRTAPEDASASNEIVITEGDINQMLVSWQAQGRPPPSAEAIRSMVEGKVREEVLYREAIAMGLDKEDTIVKRRLAQKMDFLAEDLSSLQEPTAEELRKWFEAHRDEFAQPPRVSFHHVYYSFDAHGKEARAIAAREVAAAAGPQNGDRFMFQNSYAERTEAELYSIFGPAFAHDLFTLEPGRWVGPVESAYGWHAVFVERKSPPVLPAFAEVEEDVKAAYLAARRTEFREEAYRVMREKYKVVLPKFEAPAAAPDAAVREQGSGDAS